MLLLGLLVIILLDAHNLKRRDYSVFCKIFSVRLWQVFTLAVLTGAFGFLAVENSQILVFYNMVFILPLYLIRRDQFLGFVEKNTDSDRKFELVYSVFEVIFLWIFIVTVVSICLRLLQVQIQIFSSELAEILLVNMISSVVALLLIQRAAKRLFKKDFFVAVSFTRDKQSMMKLVVVPAVFGIMCAFFSALTTVGRQVQPNTPLGELLESHNSVGTMVVFIALAVVLAPFIEEIIFRGYFYAVLKELKGKIFAFVFISLTFGILHFQQYWGDWEAMAVVTALGFLLTGVRIWTGSVIGSTVMHYFYNAGVIVLTIALLAIGDPFYFEYQLKQADLSFTQKEELLHKSILKNPQKTDAYNDLAMEYVDRNVSLDDALMFIEKALAIDSDNKTFIDTKAQILKGMKRYDEAIALRRYLMNNISSQKDRLEENKRIQELKRLKSSGAD